MKKSLLALAVAAALPAAAQAQSSIVLYGIVDASIEYSNDQANSALVSGSLNQGKSGARVQSGGWQSSRLGIRGREPIGKTGMAGIFNIEHRFQIDTGDTQGGQIFLLPGQTNTATNNKFWNGTAWVGVDFGFGEITLGRQYTPIFWAMYFPDWALNSGYNNWAATTGNPGSFAFGGLQSLYYGAVRADNSVVYKSPAIGGLTVYGMYAFGENYRPTGDSLGSGNELGSGDIWGASGVWRMGNLMVTGGYHKHNNNVFSATLNPTVIDQAFSGAIGYNFGMFGLSLGYTQLKFDNFRTAATGGNYGSKIETYLLSAYARVGPGRLYANVEQLNPSGFLNSRNGDGLQWGVTYMWELSNRTGVYVGVGSNDYSGFQPANAARALDGAMRYQIGFNHKF
jgi:predicted porin